MPRARINAVFDRTLDLIEDALQAGDIVVVKGVNVDGGRDHYARLDGERLVLRLIILHR